MRQQSERASHVVGGLAWGEASRRRLRRAFEPWDRPSGDAAPLEVRRELAGDLRGPVPEARLDSLADPLMEELASPRRDALVEHALIESVREDVASGGGAVGPCLGIAGAQEPLGAHEALARVLDRLDVRFERRRHRLGAELETRDARGLQYGHLELLQANDLQLDEVAEASRNVPLERLEVGRHDGSLVALLEPAASHQVVDRRRQEQRIPLALCVQEPSERSRRSGTTESGGQVGLDARQREEVERQLHAAVLQAEEAPHPVERPGVGDRLGSAVAAEQEKPRTLGALGEDRD